MFKKNCIIKRGITLIEVLIALVIISVCLMASLRSVNLTTNNYINLTNKSMANIIARNILVELNLKQKVDTFKAYQCQSEQDFMCQIIVDKTPNKNLFSVKILVFANQQTITPLVSLITVMRLN